ncbi:unnamed protein product, partial [Ixodes hexagonus]
MKRYRAKPKPSDHLASLSWTWTRERDIAPGEFSGKTGLLSSWCSKEAWMEKWISCRSLFTTSNIPGLRVIFRTRTLRRRLLWLFALALLGMLLLTDTGQLVKEFAEYNDVVQIGESDEGYQIALPAVTVCNLNPLRRSAFCDENITAGIPHSDYWYKKYCAENMSRD